MRMEGRRLVRHIRAAVNSSDRTRIESRRKVSLLVPETGVENYKAFR